MSAAVTSPIAFISSTLPPTLALVDAAATGVVAVVVGTVEDEKAWDVYLLSTFRLFVCLVDDGIAVAVADVDLLTVAGDFAVAEIPDTPLLISTPGPSPGPCTFRPIRLSLYSRANDDSKAPFRGVVWENNFTVANVAAVVVLVVLLGVPSTATVA